MAQPPEKKDFWTAETYGETVAPFVSLLTEKVVSWLDPQPDDVVLDVGCGEGALTARLAPRVSSMSGVDGSANLIAALQVAHPGLPAAVVDCGSPAAFAPAASGLLAAGAYTAVFSNAALHWILRAPDGRAPFFRTCAALLRPGGRLVSESGALGNVAEVHAALRHELVRGGHVAAGTGAPLTAADVDRADPWYFPSLTRMRQLVEASGLEWVRGEVELRQTTLTAGEGGGLRGWIGLFGDPFAALLRGGSAGDEWADVVEKVAQTLEHVATREEDGGVQVNYVRLRFEARKPVA